MGYTADFLGHIGIDPPLNEVEALYLLSFAASRRYDRPQGPYKVPTNPAAELGAGRSVDIERFIRVAPSQPSLWCGWQPDWDGDCLVHDGSEKCYGASAWLTYLIEHFLAPKAHAAAGGLHWFEGFTFDHTLDGTVAACRRDTRELYLIEVERNIVRERDLVSTFRVR
jgi:hypothetical protein